METRFISTEFEARSSDEGKMILAGYFARFDDIYQCCEGATESIAPGAFSESINGDVRALYNHDHNLILGRTSAGTLTLREDSNGLYGEITINPKDSDAVNAYERISRGDVSGCSFGFDVKSEEYEVKEDGSVHWTIKEVEPLYEVSPCVFPAYKGTSITARADELANIRKREFDSWKATLLTKLKGA